MSCSLQLPKDSRMQLLNTSGHHSWPSDICSPQAAAAVRMPSDHLSGNRQTVLKPHLYRGTLASLRRDHYLVKIHIIRNQEATSNSSSWKGWKWLPYLQDAHYYNAPLKKHGFGWDFLEKKKTIKNLGELLK